MPLLRTDTGVGAAASAGPLVQPAGGRPGVRVAGRPGQPAVPAGLLTDAGCEPLVDADLLAGAIPPDQVESLRPLLPVGSRIAAEAYRSAVAQLSADDLSNHYRDGQGWLRHVFGPALIDRVQRLSEGEWDLTGWQLFSAGSDVDLITHITEAVAAAGQVVIYPGDWYGFMVGATHDHAVRFDAARSADLACLCVPSVRNGHLTNEMVAFLARSPARLLNINLFPTLAAEDRAEIARALRPLLPGALLSISFSRGFGLTASQLGVLLVPPGHPFATRYRRQWDWFSYFYNALAARAFMAVDMAALAEVDAARRDWVADWLSERQLPAVASGSYYVRSFRPDGPVADHLRPLFRHGVLRCCLKPTVTG
ncbi:hypothetical protein PJK45_01310 [Mycobacterium kansasii]|uniref:hypothetical protein n=1 Tax=Mycobacterium kansasii TaxID=1768 RepID=UPI001CE3AAA8|nr:hypothetical protein [Mycobacterium kansasii]UCA18110.1 hypothetical protein LA359_17825 [Mycobacterium kansasii]UGT82972.1 hypothetical protein LTS70_09870 [Mycobacterium kansasii]UGT87247.1 hypothetical protein LTT71_03265 [Mycobacterium kansasii]UGU24486.1 hypothetical protein LT351_24225 [Mycobacterium kansasii]